MMLTILCVSFIYAQYFFVLFLFLFFFCFEHSHTPSGKKMVTGVQVVTASQVQSIKRGVQEASKIRVRELQEDYPWVNQVLSSLGGKVVPCGFGEVAKRWKSQSVLDRLGEEAAANEVKLPPRHIDDGPEGIRRDLESLGVFQRMQDGRVNIPDVFRVGYGLGRKGGVKPVR